MMRTDGVRQGALEIQRTESGDGAEAPVASFATCSVDTNVVLRVGAGHDCTVALAVAVADLGGQIGDLVTLCSDHVQAMRQVALRTRDDAHTSAVLAAIQRIPGVTIHGVSDAIMDCHRGGKIKQASRAPLRTEEDLRRVYTPGVARVATAIRERPARALELTGIGNSVGIFTNGTRVLGLGDIGPLASMPVMEGKSVIYEQLVGISATPILVDTKDPSAFVETVLRVSPTFAGIHLEDICSPDCFAIEEELSRRLRRPVLHDDQHGTSTVALAALIRACALTGTKLASACVGQIGLGAAGSAIARLVALYGVRRVLVTDPSSSAMERVVRSGVEAASLETVLRESDIVIATTGHAGLIAPERVRRGQVFLALSNPVPEIDPEVAREAGAALAADGRSINNALAFPGLFLGAFKAQSRAIVPAMLIAAARAIAGAARGDDLVPSVLDRAVHTAVAQAVEAKAEELGLRQTLVVDDAWTRGKAEPLPFSR
jgi:malate dehydrogenase (oxaloacetate-decarboxylating)